MRRLSLFIALIIVLVVLTALIDAKIPERAAAGKVRIMYDFNGVVVNRTCYLVKRGPMPGGMYENVGLEDFVKLVPRVKKFEAELRKLPHVYVWFSVGDDIIRLAEEALASGDWRDDPLWARGIYVGVRVHVFGNETLALEIAKKAEGLGVPVTIFHINAKDAARDIWLNIEEMYKFTDDIMQRYMALGRRDGFRGLSLGMESDAPIISITIFNVTSPEIADREARILRNLIPCEYPVVYEFADLIFGSAPSAQSRIAEAAVVAIVAGAAVAAIAFVMWRVKTRSK